MPSEVLTSDGVDFRQREQKLPAALAKSRLALHHAGFEMPGQDHQDIRITGMAFRFRDDGDPGAGSVWLQDLDPFQIPRMPEDMKAYKEALAPRNPAAYPLIAREWMLTNTRYLLGAAGYLAVLNEQLDPVQHRFKIVQRFDLQPNPGVPHLSQLEELTAVNNDAGELALFEFTGALPRAQIHGHWQVNTNDAANLKTLGDLNFDPAETVLVSTPEKDLPAAATNGDSGSVDYQSYTSKHIGLSARTTSPSVLLLNDKSDPY